MMHCGEGYRSKRNIKKLIIVQSKREGQNQTEVYIRKTVKDEYRCYIRKNS